MSESIVFSHRDHVGNLLLNDPARHNSLGEKQLMAIQRLLTESTPADLRVLVISGAGDRTFCAGASLKELGSGKISGDLFQETTDMIAELPFPTIAAINGNVFGGGVELALSCDFRVGVEGALLRVPAAAIGLCYPPPGIERFVQRLGVSAAKRLLLAAEEFDESKMREIGFLDYCVPRDQLKQTVSRLSEELSGLAPLAVRAMKQIIHEAAAASIDVERARALANQCYQSRDLQEGFAAQREKRKPQFEGN